MIEFPLSTIRLNKGNLIKLFYCQSLHKINRVVIMKSFHGTYEKVAPIIKIGEFAMSGNNVFDGLFASPDRQNTHTVRAGKRCSRLFTEKR